MTEPELVAHGPAVEFRDQWPTNWPAVKAEIQSMQWELLMFETGFAYHAALTADGKGER